ncbi:MAG: M13 family metallopeptidase [Bacteroidota bacterium]|nr:M13 family metallopeptidase [Bacteroidota bacterium]
MKKNLWYLPMTFAMIATGYNSTVAASGGLNMGNLDKKILPGTDFYRFATGGWCDANPIPDEYSRYGTFIKLAQQNELQIKDLITDLGKTQHDQGSVAQKIGDLYKLGMDSVKLNNDGAAPIKEELATIHAANTREDVINLLISLRRKGINPFISVAYGPDDKNSSLNIMHVYQGDLGMGEREYYLLNDDASKKLREGYVKLIEKQFVNAGYSETDAQKASAAIMGLETAMATADFPKEKLRIPELNYHKLAVSQLNDSVAAFEWSRFFEGIGAKQVTSLNVGQKEPVAAAINLIKTAPVEDIKALLSWDLIKMSAKYLSDNFVNANFEFYGKQLSGAKVLQPRWKRTVSTVGNTLGEAVGQMYVQKYFPAEAKERMLKLVDNLKLSLGERISELAWMSDATKAKAQEKLSAITVKIGYPDKWRDYSALNIKDDSYWANIERAIEFDYDYELNKLDKPVDKTEWLMTPQTVNAYYNPTSNEICFPAGILQPPFFYMKGDDAINYGAIGVVIGHEMTHGFDDQGRKYDKEGNMADWWTADDAARFDKRTNVLVDYFNSLVVLGDLHANGTYTLGENIADHGGLQVSYNAFSKTKEAKSTKKIEGYTESQRFFLAYANVWANNIRDEESVRLTKIDPHSLCKWRVDGALPHIDAWYKAFNITPKDPLYLPKEKRASIW